MVRHPIAPKWTGLPAGLLERILGLPLSHVQLVRGGSETNGTDVEVLRECTFLTRDTELEIKADAIFSSVSAWPAQLLHLHGAIPPALSDDQQGSIVMELPAPGYLGVAYGLVPRVLDSLRPRLPGRANGTSAFFPKGRTIFWRTGPA